MNQLQFIDKLFSNNTRFGDNGISEFKKHVNIIANMRENKYFNFTAKCSKTNLNRFRSRFKDLKKDFKKMRSYFSDKKSGLDDFTKYGGTKFRFIICKIYSYRKSELKYNFHYYNFIAKLKNCLELSKDNILTNDKFKEYNKHYFFLILAEITNSFNLQSSIQTKINELESAKIKLIDKINNATVEDTNSELNSTFSEIDKSKKTTKTKKITLKIDKINELIQNLKIRLNTKTISKKIKVDIFDKTPINNHNIFKIKDDNDKFINNLTKRYILEIKQIVKKQIEEKGNVISDEKVNNNLKKNKSRLVLIKKYLNPNLKKIALILYSFVYYPTAKKIRQQKLYLQNKFCLRPYDELDFCKKRAKKIKKDNESLETSFQRELNTLTSRIDNYCLQLTTKIDVLVSSTVLDNRKNFDKINFYNSCIIKFEQIKNIIQTSEGQTIEDKTRLINKLSSNITQHSNNPKSIIEKSLEDLKNVFNEFKIFKIDEYKTYCKGFNTKLDALFMDIETDYENNKSVAEAAASAKTGAAAAKGKKGGVSPAAPAAPEKLKEFADINALNDIPNEINKDNIKELINKFISDNKKEFNDYKEKIGKLNEFIKKLEITDENDSDLKKLYRNLRNKLLYSNLVDNNDVSKTKDDDFNKYLADFNTNLEKIDNELLNLKQCYFNYTFLERLFGNQNLNNFLKKKNLDEEFKNIINQSQDSTIKSLSITTYKDFIDNINTTVNISDIEANFKNIEDTLKTVKINEDSSKNNNFSKLIRTTDSLNSENNLINYINKFINQCRLEIQSIKGEQENIKNNNKEEQFDITDISGIGKEKIQKGGDEDFFNTIETPVFDESEKDYKNIMELQKIKTNKIRVELLRYFERTLFKLLNSPVFILDDRGITKFFNLGDEDFKPKSTLLLFSNILLTGGALGLIKPEAVKSAKMELKKRKKGKKSQFIERIYLNLVMKILDFGVINIKLEDMDGKIPLNYPNGTAINSLPNFMDTLIIKKLTTLQTLNNPDENYSDLNILNIKKSSIDVDFGPINKDYSLSELKISYLTNKELISILGLTKDTQIKNELNEDKNKIINEIINFNYNRDAMKNIRKLYLDNILNPIQSYIIDQMRENKNDDDTQKKENKMLLSGINLSSYSNSELQILFKLKINDSHKHFPNNKSIEEKKDNNISSFFKGNYNSFTDDIISEKLQYLFYILLLVIIFKKKTNNEYEYSYNDIIQKIKDFPAKKNSQPNERLLNYFNIKIEDFDFITENIKLNTLNNVGMNTGKFLLNATFLPLIAKAFGKGMYSLGHFRPIFKKKYVNRYSTILFNIFNFSDLILGKSLIEFISPTTTSSTTATTATTTTASTPELELEHSEDDLYNIIDYLFNQVRSDDDYDLMLPTTDKGKIINNSDNQKITNIQPYELLKRKGFSLSNGIIIGGIFTINFRLIKILFKLGVYSSSMTVIGLLIAFGYVSKGLNKGINKLKQMVGGSREIRRLNDYFTTIINNFFNTNRTFLPLNIIYNSVNFLLENMLTNLSFNPDDTKNKEEIKLEVKKLVTGKGINFKNNKGTETEKVYDTVFAAKLLYYYIHNYNNLNDSKPNDSNSTDSKPNGTKSTNSESNINIIELLIISDDISSSELSYKKKLREILMKSLYEICNNNNNINTRKIMLEVIYNFFELIDKESNKKLNYENDIKQYIEQKINNSFYSFINHFLSINIDFKCKLPDIKKIIFLSRKSMIELLHKKFKNLFNDIESSKQENIKEKELIVEEENTLIFTEDTLKYIIVKDEEKYINDEEISKNFEKLIKFVKFDNLIKKNNIFGKNINYKKDYLDHAMFRFGLVKLSATLLAFRDNFAKFSYQIQKQNYILGVRTISDAKKNFGKGEKLVQTTDEKLFDVEDFNEIEKLLLNNKFNGAKMTDIKKFCKLGIINLLQYYKLYIEKLLIKGENTSNDVTNSKKKGNYVELKSKFDKTITKMLMFLRCNMFYNDYVNNFKDKIKEIFLEYDKKVKEYSNIIVTNKNIDFQIEKIDNLDNKKNSADISIKGNDISIEPLPFEIGLNKELEISLTNNVKLVLEYTGSGSGPLVKGIKELEKDNFEFKIEANHSTELHEYLKKFSTTPPSSPSPPSTTYENINIPVIQSPAIIQLKKDDKNVELFDVQKKINKEIEIVNTLSIDNSTLSIKSDDNNVDENNSFIKLINTINEFNNKGGMEYLTSEESLLSEYYKDIQNTAPGLLESNNAVICYIFDENIFIPNADYLTFNVNENTECNKLIYNYNSNKIIEDTNLINIKYLFETLFEINETIGFKNQGGKDNVLSKIISQLFYLNKEDIKSNYVKLTKHLKNIYNKYNTTDNTSNTSYNKIYFKIKQKYDKPSFLEKFIDFLNRGDIINNFSIPEEISNLFKMFTTDTTGIPDPEYKYEFVLCNEYDYTDPSSTSPSPSSPPPTFSMIKKLRINQYYKKNTSIIKLENSKYLFNNDKVDKIIKSVRNLDYIIQLNLNLDLFEISNYSRFDNTLLTIKSSGSTGTISSKLKELVKTKKPIIDGKINDIYKKEIDKSEFTNYEMITKTKNTN